MNTHTVRANILLLLTAVIWGVAFVAQRMGMEHVGPFTFNGVRFALGGLSLLPLLFINRKKAEETSSMQTKSLIWGGFLAGCALFTGASLQQIGIVYTTAGKAGFITGLYVVIVPILGLLWKQHTSLGTWLGACLAVIGMYLLSVTGQFTISHGDLLVLIGAFFWAAHVQLIGWLTRRMDTLKIAFLQCITCSLFSLVTAFFTERVTRQGLTGAFLPICYGGLLSVGVAYTLQVVAQRHAHAAHAAIILSLESVFAAISGWLILHELLSLRGIIGCVLMLAGMFMSQCNLTREGLRSRLSSLCHRQKKI
ncbi:EamA family transporter [candidate division KSB3 bacterium]|uniref:EamA family transporter n=1 Tax=candidate division KSB3 bacterium TaxID=2044937 RepID=A0A2G6K8R8_9BACT|nr:MAG: EamA family transporter [candidate division KSB3 bacterium]